MLDGGLKAQARASTVQEERKEVYAALQYEASFHSLVEEWKDCEELEPKSKEKKHRTEWCVTEKIGAGGAEGVAKT